MTDLLGILADVMLTLVIVAICCKCIVYYKAQFSLNSDTHMLRMQLATEIDE